MAEKHEVAKKVADDDSHYIVDMRKVSSLPNGDMVQQRPRGYERPDTIDVSDLERQAIAKRARERAMPQEGPAADQSPFDHAAKRRMTTSQDVVDQAVADAKEKV